MSTPSSADDLGRALRHSRNRVEPRERVGLLGGARGDLPVAGRDGVVEELDVPQQVVEEKAVMGGDAAGERLRERRALPPQTPLGELRHLRGRLVAGDERLDHGARRDPEDLGGDTAELDVRGLKDLLQSIGLLRPVLDQPLPVAHDVAELPLRARGHEAAAQQAELQQLGEPLAVPHIRLAARHHLDVLGVDQGELEAPFEEVVHGAPEDAGGLHGDVRAAGGSEPVRQPE